MPVIRPLAILTLLLGALFALKALALANGAAGFLDARAEAREAEEQVEEPASEPAERMEYDLDPAPPEETGSAAPVPAPAQEDSASRNDLLVALAERRRTLDAREAELDTREGLIEVAEQRVEERITRLEELHGEVQTLLGELDTEREQEITSLVNTYANLEPEAAAIILRQMDDMDSETLLLVARELQTASARRFAAIVGEMADLDPAFAASLTSRLRVRSMPPETVAQLEAELDAARN